MNAIANFAAWVWHKTIVFVKALNHALETPRPNQEFVHTHDDTVFQPRDF